MGYRWVDRVLSDIAFSAHSLRITRHHRDRTEIVKDIFRRNGFPSNSRFGKSDVFGDCRIQMMANHGFGMVQF